MEELLFGKRIIEVLLKDFPKKIIELYVKPKHPLISLIEEKKIPYKIWDKRQFSMNFRHKNHQYIGAKVTSYDYYPLNNLFKNFEKDTTKKRLVLLIDHLEDAHNLGAICRTAYAVGADAVVIPRHAQVDLNSVAIKASSGYAFYLKIIRVSNLNHVLERFKENNFWSISSDMNGENIYQTENNLENTNIVLIVGNEHKGVRQLLNKNSDWKYKIPMVNAESLNVSNAAALFLYYIRQKQNYWK